MAVTFDALNQIYNHYLTEYAPKSNTSLETHKKSDLRNIYNTIVKMNKESPLYILDSSRDSKAYAIGLKESARRFRNSVVATRSSLDEDGVLSQKKAYSTRPEIASVKYLGTHETDVGALAPTFRLEVASLATPQVNFGKPVPSEDMVALPAGDYSFDVSVKDLSYEFQFKVQEGDTNRNMLERLQRLITNAGIGIDASILEDGEGNSALKLTSTSTGVAPDRDFIFEISDENTSKANGIVDYFGLNQMTREPSNALFEINGIERSAASNTFTVEKLYEVTLNGPSSEPGITTEIGLKNDIDSFSENIHSLTENYNRFLKEASSYQGSHARSGQLLSEIGYITRHYSGALYSIGLTFASDGTISIDDEKLQTVASEENGEELLSPVKDFANSMLRKSTQIALNPMQYVNKTVVAYKNPGKNYPSPYITSAYSGMLFNNYC